MDPTEGEGHVMVGVDKAPKEREGPIKDAGCEKGDGETRRTFDHPLAGALSFLCPSPTFSSLFCSVSLSTVVASRLASDRERKREKDDV